MIHALWHWLTEERSDHFWLVFLGIYTPPTLWLLYLCGGIS